MSPGTFRCLLCLFTRIHNFQLPALHFPRTLLPQDQRLAPPIFRLHWGKCKKTYTVYLRKKKALLNVVIALERGGKAEPVAPGSPHSPQRCNCVTLLFITLTVFFLSLCPQAAFLVVFGVIMGSFSLAVIAVTWSLNT